MFQNKIIIFLIFLFLTIFIVDAHAYLKTCTTYFLRTDTGEIINPISGENADQPYSTKQTCGICHDYEKISKGYHFNMDWDKASDDMYKNTDTPWLVSTGLTGNLTTVGYYQLAKKENTHADEIDLTSFTFASQSLVVNKTYVKPSCAGCHAGGGMLEHDRDGLRYDKRLNANPALALSLDGDYYQSRWDKSGIIEVDCFFCHSSRYNMQARINQMKNLNFKWAGTAASGIGQVYGKVADSQIPRVVYNKRLFNEDGTFVMPSFVYRPKAENCLLCHATIDTGKRGTSWGDRLNPDVHHLAGLTCIDCHFGDINHNFVKGDTLANNVRNGLDNTMRSCEECHTTGYRGATLMKHGVIRQDHLDKISCQACHIPMLHRSAIGAMYLNTGKFIKHGQLNGEKYGQAESWKPAYIKRKSGNDKIEKIFPVNPIYSVLFTNKNKQNQYYPLFLSEIEKAYRLCEKYQSKKTCEYDFHNPDDVKNMLKTLKTTLSNNKRFKQIHPCFHNAGKLYFLDDNSNLIKEKDNTWVNKIPFFSISHNVAPVQESLGANGCTDCHSRESHMFNGAVVIDYFGDKGKPFTTTTGALLGIASSTLRLNLFFHQYLSKILPTLLICLLILLIFLSLRFFNKSRSIAIEKNKQAYLISIIIKALLLMTLISMAHIMLFENTSIMGSIQSKIMNYGKSIFMIIIIVTVLFFIYFIQRYKTNNILSLLLNINAVLMLATGLMLYNKIYFSINTTLIIEISHGILSVFFTGLFIGFVYLKANQYIKSPGNPFDKESLSIFRK